ncbi:hypothetical protein LIER_36228 [Lithospermum erythrorhizon]|uniref:ATP-dependent DNA helicase n=1 Tax=Lithospermum erythrorhizon TaxID=34254 RepID=A0AAV3P5C7_LITER
MLLSGGRTTHSRFNIPILLEPGSKCGIKKQSELCELICISSAIIWDEAPMADRKAFEALDKTFRFLLDNQLSFGGKIMILGGDFRQVFPVVLGGTREQTVMASIIQYSLWKNVTILHLRENMRAHHNYEFSNFLLRVGDGEKSVTSNDMIMIPDSMAIPWEGEESITRLIDFMFPDLSGHAYDIEYMMDRTLIMPLNEDVNKINEKIIQSFLGKEVTYYSFDSVSDDLQNLYQQEFLNSLVLGNFPPHKLTMKK